MPNPNVLNFPGVAAGLRRAQLASISAPQSVAARNDPNAGQTVLARQYPGLFGPNAGPTGQDQVNAKNDQLIQNQQRVLTLRNQNLALQLNPQVAQQTQQINQNLGLRRAQMMANGYNTNILGSDDDEDEQPQY